MSRSFLIPLKTETPNMLLRFYAVAILVVKTLALFPGERFPVFCEIQSNVQNSQEFKFHLCTHVVFSLMDIFIDWNNVVAVKHLQNVEELRKLNYLRTAGEKFKLLVTVKIQKYDVKQCATMDHFDDIINFYESLEKKLYVNGLVIREEMDDMNRAEQIIWRLSLLMQEKGGELYLDSPWKNYKKMTRQFDGVFLNFSLDDKDNTILPKASDKNLYSLPSMDSIIKKWTSVGFPSKTLIGEIDLQFKLYEEDKVFDCIDDIKSPYKHVYLVTPEEVASSNLVWQNDKKHGILCAYNSTHLVFPETMARVKDKTHFFKKKKLGGFIIRNFHAEYFKENNRHEGDLIFTKSAIDGFRKKLT